MAATIKTLTLLALAALASPPALAQLDVLDAPSTPLPPVPALEEAGRMADDATAPLQEVLQCKQAVHVRLVWHVGTVTDTRSGSEDWVHTRQFVDVTVYENPVYRDVERLVPAAAPDAGAAGLVDAVGAEAVPVPALPAPDQREVPRTETVRVLDHVERVSVETVRNVDLALHADWLQEFVDWDVEVEEAWVALPAGAPLLASRHGTLVQVCDGRELASVSPSLVRLGYACLDPCSPRDGWVTVRYGVAARILGVDDLGLQRRSTSTCVCPGQVAAGLADEVQALGLAGTTTVVQGTPPGAGQASSSAQPAGQDAAGASPSATALGGAPMGLAGLAGLASLGLLALRTRKP